MDWSEHEESWLAPYAMRSGLSRGRQYPEESHAFRTLFQRDRERIVHCTAFRRMVGKTQVLVGQINDHHRTRLTHTLEVAQISRTMARRLRLNEDLVEAIALSHDIGHPPFGHAGESALEECTKDVGGFDHNLYGLRRVDWLEDRYPEFPGLNLSWELREAFVQHSKRRELVEFADFFAAGGPLLEAQIADAADSLAYDAHDTDDALGIGLIRLAELEEVPFWRQIAEKIRARYGTLPEDAFRRAVIRDLISWQVVDLIHATEQRIRALRIGSIADVRAQCETVVGFSSEVLELKSGLEAFLRTRVYRHHKVVAMAATGQRLLRRLFAELVANPELLPDPHLLRWENAPEKSLRARHAVVPFPKAREVTIERVVADYLAGMTDRFARQEYVRLFHSSGDS